LDLLWLAIPAAIAIFVVRVVLIARSLRAAARNPTLADVRALREAKRSLGEHRERLGKAKAAGKEHLATAKRLGRAPVPRPRKSHVDQMVEAFLPNERT